MNEITSYEEAVSVLANALSHRSLYSDDHPRVRASTESFAATLTKLLREDRKEAFFLGVVKGRLVHDGRFLLGATLLGRRLVDLATRMKCGGFLFRAGLTSDEVRSFCSVAASLRKGVEDLQEARAMLERTGVKGIEISPPYEHPGWLGQFLFTRKESWGAEGISEDSLQLLVPAAQGMYETVEGAHQGAEGDHAIDVAGARGTAEKLLQAAQGDFGDILQVVRYPDYDSYTVGHSVRVALFAVMLGHRLGLPRETLVELGTAGMLHDVGKAKIPHEILFKPGRLDEDERRIVSRHPVDGARILLENPGTSALGIAAAWGHHLRHDRKGYPTVPAWVTSSRVTGMVQVCDVFEALTAVRPYKPALSPARAYEIMLRDRGAFDPSALAALMQAIGMYPPGSRVRLSSGELALVVSPGARIAAPVVRLTHAREGGVLDAKDARTVDLSAPEAGSSVVGIVQDAAPRSTAA